MRGAQMPVGDGGDGCSEFVQVRAEEPLPCLTESIVIAGECADAAVNRAFIGEGKPASQRLAGCQQMVEQEQGAVPVVGPA